MKCILQIGQTGEKHRYESLNPRSKVEELEKRIARDFGIPADDQLLIDHFGSLLTSSLLLSEAENEFIKRESLFNSRKNSEEEMKNSNSSLMIYIFDKRSLNEDNIFFSKILDQKLKRQNPLHAANSPQKQLNITSRELEDLSKKLFNNFSLSPLPREKLLSEYPDYSSNSQIESILGAERRLYDHYNQSLQLYANLMQESQKLRISLDEGSLQIMAIDVLIRHGIQNYDSLSELKSRIKMKMGDDENSFSGIVSKFNAAIVKLENTKLHPAFQKEGCQNLIDIYYSKAKMDEWKALCFKKKDTLKNEFHDYLNEIKSVKEMIKKLKSKNLHKNKEKKNVKIHSVSMDTSEIETKAERVFRTIRSFYTTLRNEIEQFFKLNKISSNGSLQNLQSMSLQALKTLDDPNTNLQALQNLKTRISEKQEEIENSRIQFEKDCLEVFRSIFGITSSINAISCQLISFMNSKLAELTKNFKNLLKPSQMTEAYHATLREISRRREFISKFYPEYTEIREQLKTENLTRNQFLKQYGEIIPFKFVPNLTAILPSLPSEAKFSEDLKLPLIEGYHSEQDNKVTQKAAGDPLPQKVDFLENQKLLKKVKNLGEELDEIRKKSQEKTSQMLGLQREVLSLKQVVKNRDEEVQNLSFLKEVQNGIFEQSEDNGATGRPGGDIHRLFGEIKAKKYLPYLKKLTSGVSSKIFNFFTKKISKKNNLLLQLETKLQEKERNYQDHLEEQQRSHEGAVDELMARIENLNKNLREIHERYKELYVERDEEQALLSEEVSSLRAAFEEKSKNLKKILSEKTSLSEENNELRQRIYRAEQDLQTQRSLMVAENSKKSQKMKIEENEKNGQIEEDRRRFEAMEARIKNLEWKIKVTLEEKTKISRELESKTNKLGNVRSELEMSRQNEEKIKHQFTIMKNENSKLKGLNLNAETTRQDGERDLEVLRGVVQEQKAEIESSKRKYENMKLLLDSSDVEVERAKEKLRKKSIELKNSQNQLENLRFKFSKKESEIENLSIKIKSLEHQDKLNAQETLNLTSKLEEFQKIIKEKNSKIEGLNHSLDQTKALRSQFAAKQKSFEDTKLLYHKIIAFSPIITEIKINRFMVFLRLRYNVWVPLTLSQVSSDPENWNLLTQKELTDKIALNQSSFMEDKEIDYVLEMASLTPDLLQILKTKNTQILVAKVTSITTQPISLVVNRELVSLTTKAEIQKVSVERVLVACGFEDSMLRFSDFGAFNSVHSSGEKGKKSSYLGSGSGDMSLEFLDQKSDIN